MKTWRHRCLRAPGREGRPTTVLLPIRGCNWCGDPGPEKQKQVDAEAARILKQTQEAASE